MVIGLALVPLGQAPVLIHDGEVYCNGGYNQPEGCAEGSPGGSGGYSDEDRDYVWRNWEDMNSSKAGTFTYVSASLIGDLDPSCYEETISADLDEGENSTTQVSYSCGQEWAVQLPFPEIALLTAGTQATPPCGEQNDSECPAGTFLIPVFGSWSGTITIELYQDEWLVSSETLLMEPRSYGMISGQTWVNLTDDYELRLIVKNDMGQTLDQDSDLVTVMDPPQQYWLQETEYAEWGAGANYVFIARGTIQPKAPACIRVIHDESFITDEAASGSFPVISAAGFGGADRVPTQAMLGSDCASPWNATQPMVEKPYGT